MFPVRQGSVQRLRRFSLCRLLEGGQSRPCDKAGDALTFGLMYSKDGHRFYLMLKDAETLKERPVTKEDMDMLEKQILGRAEVRAAEAGGQEDQEFDAELGDMTMPQGYYELAWLAAEERAGRPTEGER